MQRDVPFKGQRDWQIARYVLGGIVGFAILAQVLVYFSLVALVHRPYAAAVVGAALISLLMGAPLIVIAAMQFRRAQRLRNQINHVAAHDTTTGALPAAGSSSMSMALSGAVNALSRSFKGLHPSADQQPRRCRRRLRSGMERRTAAIRRLDDQHLVRRDDIVARTGPASFDVLLVGATETDAEQVCARLTTTLTSSHFSADGRKVDLALSVGGALFEGSVDLERLRRAAASESVAVAAGAPESVGFVRLPSA